MLGVHWIESLVPHPRRLPGVVAIFAHPLSGKILVVGLGLCVALGATSADAASKAETETYVVQLNVKPKYEAKRPAALEVVILAKAGYKINDKFPTKFTLDPAPRGISYPKTVLNKTDGAFDEKRAILKLNFVPSQAGTARLGGNASFSVCNKATCVVGKQHLDVTVQVK